MTAERSWFDVRRKVFDAITVALFLFLVVQTSSAAPPGDVPADLRAALEGTWQLEEWHADGQILKPPQADGRWSLHDGVVIFTVHRTDTAESSVGFGEYRLDATTWRYRYTRMQRTSGAIGGPVTMSAAPPETEMRVFSIKRGAGGKVTLENGDAQHEYDGPFFTLRQQGKIVRKWRRVAPAAP